MINWRFHLIVGLLAGGALLFSNQAWCERPVHWDGFENRVNNPGFENNLSSDEVPSFWKGQIYDDASWAGMASPGYLSGRAISLRGSGEWVTEISGIKPHAWYLLSFKVKREGWKDGEYPNVKIFDREIYQNELFSHGGWRTVSYLLNSGSHRETALKFWGKGLTDKILYDNVSLQELTISALSPEEGEVVRGKGINFVWAVPRDKRVYKIRIQFSRAGDFENSYMAESYSPLGNRFQLRIPLKNGKWFWKISLWHNNLLLADSQIASFVVANSSFPDLKKILADKSGDLPDKAENRIRVSKDFFPIGIYGAPIKAIPEIREAGFNLVQSYNTDLTYIEDFVESAERNGMKALSSIFNLRPGPETSALLSKLKNNAGLFGWYIADEPEGRGISPAKLWKLSRFIHDHDPYHPTSLVNVRSSKVADYGPAVDIALVDPYPIPHMPMTWLSDSIDEAKSSVGHRKHVWAVIQAFSWNNVGPKFAMGRGRFPTYEEGKCLAFLSVVHGVNGLIFFSYNSARENDPDLENWSNVKRIVKDLNNIYPLLLSQNSGERMHLETVSIARDENAEMNLPVFDANGNPAVHYAIKIIESNPIDSEKYLVAKGRYLIAVNVLGKPVKANFSDQSLSDGYARDILGNRTVKIVQNKMTANFGPYAVQIYKLN